MKNFWSIACGLAVLAATFAAIADGRPYGYRSRGIDTYASGEPVRDGECYALVWAREGSVFSGFYRDGSLFDEANNAVVYVRSLAEDGQCPPVNFMIPTSFIESHRDGKYVVVVLDTRDASGNPTGLDEQGSLVCVNGWDFANVSFCEIAQVGGDVSGRTALGGAPAYAGSRVLTPAIMPANCRKPLITGIVRNESGDAVVECAQTERYNKYRVTFGKTPFSAREKVGSQLGDGKGDGKLNLKLSSEELKGMSSAFMQVEAVTDLKDL